MGRKRPTTFTGLFADFPDPLSLLGRTFLLRRVGSAHFVIISRFFTDTTTTGNNAPGPTAHHHPRDAHYSDRSATVGSTESPAPAPGTRHALHPVSLPSGTHQATALLAGWQAGWLHRLVEEHLGSFGQGDRWGWLGEQHAERAAPRDATKPLVSLPEPQGLAHPRHRHPHTHLPASAASPQEARRASDGGDDDDRG